jgi:hypothetical protein
MPNDREITVIIQSGRGSQQFTFQQQTKVEDAARQAATALGYPADGSYALVYNGEELAGQRPLVSYQIEDGATLILSATGSGV